MTLLDDAPAPDPEKVKDSPDDKSKPQDKDDQVPEWLAAAKDDNLKKNPTLRRFKSLDEQLVGHVALKSKLGENPVSLPDKDDPPEKMTEFFETHLGVPKEAAGYKESLKFPEKHNEEVDNAFLITAKKLDLQPRQVQGLYDWLDEFGTTSAAKQAVDAKKANDDNLAELTKMYGHDLKKNETIAEMVLTKLFPDGALAKLKKAGLARDPLIFPGLVKAGQQLYDSEIKGLKGETPTGKKSKDELEQLMKDPRYKTDQNYFDMVAKEWEKAYPNKQG